MNDSIGTGERVVFLGSKSLGYNVLKAVYRSIGDSLVKCITIDDKDDTRSELLNITSFCENFGIRCDVVGQYEKIDSYVNESAPTMCIVVCWYSLISKELISSVDKGFVGVHNSLLPLYRGQAPVVWAMINGEKYTGFSVFSFDEGMDTGKIWYQKKIAIEDNDYVEDVLNRIESEVVSFFEENCEAMLNGVITPYSQQSNNVSYGAKRVASDGKIDWRWSAKRVYNFVRAISKPYPGAFTFYQGEKYTIWSIDVFDYPAYGAPGQIVLINKEEKYIVVACGDDSAVIIRDVTTKGKVVNTTDFVKSVNIRME